MQDFALVKEEISRSISRTGLFCMDLETTGLDFLSCRILGIAVAAGSRQWYINVHSDHGYPYYDVISWLQEILSNESYVWLNHNIKFDICVLKAAGIETKCKIIDTLIAAHLLDETRAGTSRLKLKGKGGLIHEEFGILLPEWEMSELGGNLLGKSEEEYAKDDVIYTMKLWRERFLPRLKKQPYLWKWFHEVAMPITKIVAAMEFRGCLIDKPFLEDAWKQIEKEMDDLAQELFKMAKRTFNLNSGDELSEILFSKDGLGLAIPKSAQITEKGRVSVDAKRVLSYLRDNEFVQKYLAWKQREKMLNTYVKGILKRLNTADGRLHTSFWQAGTATGRFCVGPETKIATNWGVFAISTLPTSLVGTAMVMTHKQRQRHILGICYKGKEMMYKVVSTTGKSIRCTANHRFLTPSGWQCLSSLAQGAKICIMEDGIKIDTIQSITEDIIDDVWDLEVEEDHSYIACGFINHNSSRNPNLQNIPRKQGGESPLDCTIPIKRAFIAGPGMMLLAVDYNQLELRVMAHRSQDENMIRVYEKELDLHDQTRIKLGLPKEQRSIAKSANFGLLYGQTPEGFRNYLFQRAHINASLADCKKWHNDFFAAYPGLVRYYKQIKEQLKETGIVYSITGRPRHLKKMVKEDFQQAFRIAVNYTIQASAADIILIAMRNIQRRVDSEPEKWHGFQIINQIHDELLVECPEEIAEEALAMVKYEMENAVKLRVRLKAEGKCGKSWDVCK